MQPPAAKNLVPELSLPAHWLPRAIASDWDLDLGTTERSNCGLSTESLSFNISPLKILKRGFM
jgi:hypothetical protein